jgi:hypothetical protein
MNPETLCRRSSPTSSRVRELDAVGKRRQYTSPIKLY